MCPTLLADLEVEILITTSTAEAPGVTGADGLNEQCAPAGSPFVQASVTAPVNEAPTGCTVSAYGPEVSPAITVWLKVEDVTTKSGAIVKETD